MSTSNLNDATTKTDELNNLKPVYSSNPNVMSTEAFPVAKVPTIDAETFPVAKVPTIDAETFPVAKVTTSQLTKNWNQTLLLQLQKKCREVTELKAALDIKDETICHMINSISTQASTILDLEVSNKRLQKHLAIVQSKPVTADKSTSATVETLDNKEKSLVVKMANMVDNLAKKYSPRWARPDKYVQSGHSNPDNSQDFKSPKKGRPSIVPKIFSSLWRLYLAPPPPTYKPKDIRPVVNLTKVNFHLKRNLPKAEYFPVFGPVQDPAHYMDTYYRNSWDDTCTKKSPFFRKEGFQKLPGLRTDLGILAMPEGPVHGFIWVKDLNDWVLAAGRSYRREKKKGREDTLD